MTPPPITQIAIRFQCSDGDILADQTMLVQSKVAVDKFGIRTLHMKLEEDTFETGYVTGLCTMILELFYRMALSNEQNQPERPTEPFNPVVLPSPDAAETQENPRGEASNESPPQDTV